MRRRAMEQKVIEALNLTPGSKVLDFGCGHGYVAIYAAKHGGLDVQGIDLVDHHVVNAQKNIAWSGYKDHVRVDQGNYQDLSRFPDGSFDGAYGIETFVHSPDAEEVSTTSFHYITDCCCRVR